MPVVCSLLVQYVYVYMLLWRKFTEVMFIISCVMSHWICSSCVMEFPQVGDGSETVGEGNEHEHREIVVQ